MTTVKRVPDIYHIQSPKVVIDGNLYVTGDSTSLVSTDTEITDNKITLNAGTPIPVPSGAYIEVDRGGGLGQATVSLRWHEYSESEPYNSWQFTNDGAYYANIGSGAGDGGGGGGLSSVSGDLRPTLSGNLNLQGASVWDSNNPTANISLYTGAVKSGGTGLYVTNSANPGGKEIATVSKAVTFGIIFS